MFHKKWFYFILLFSPSAFADVDYYTYGGFESVRNAFLRLAAIFGNPDYDGYIFAIAIAGVAVGYLITLGKGFMGGGLKGYDALVTLAVVIFGVTLYTVVIRPTTTVHIYDETTNQYESVGGIPTLIANAVQLPNILERGMTTIVDTSTVYTRSEHANGATLELLLNSLNGNPLSHDSYLNRSLYSFIDTCMPPALNSNLYPFNLNEMMSSTSNLLAELEKLKSLSIPVMYYDLANKGGISVSCTTSYNSLATILSLPSTYVQYRKAVCEKSGFDTTIAAQLVICEQRLTEMSNLVFGNGVMGSDTQLYMGQAIAKVTYETLSNYAGTAISDIANYREMSQGYGNVIVSEGWIPSIRSSTLVIILSILPVLVLFLVTPMIFKSLHLIITLFIFVGLWGISDAIVHNIIIDQVGDLMSSLKTYNGSVTSFMMAPTDINKGLATFGKLQSMAVILAGFFSAVFFKLSSRAFSQMGERLADNVDSLGASTGQQVLDPNQRMNTMEGNATVYEKFNQMQAYGSTGYQQAVAGHNTQGVRTEQNYLESMSSKFDYNDALDVRSQSHGGESAGNVMSTAESASANNQSTSNYSQSIASTRTGQSLAGTEIDQKNIGDIGKEQNLDNKDAINTKVSIDKSSQTGSYKADSNPDNHVRAAETGTEIRLASSDIDNKNIDHLQSELETNREGAVDAFSAIHKSGETGLFNASANVDNHNTAATVSSTQHLKDKMSYKAVAEAQGKSVDDKALNEYTQSHEIASGEIQAKKQFIEDNKTDAVSFGKRKEATELETAEATQVGREIAVEEGLANSTQDAAIRIGSGQDFDFLSQYNAKEGFSEVSGKNLGQVYTDGNTHVSQAMTKENAELYKEAINMNSEQQSALYATALQISDIANGKSNEITVDSNKAGWDTLNNLGLTNIQGGLEGAPFTAQMSQEEAANKLQLLDPAFVEFANANEALIDATIANDGSVTAYDLASTPGGNNPSIVKKETNAGDNITEKNQHTIENGVKTDSQTMFDTIMTEENEDEAIRQLDIITSTSSSLKDGAFALTHQLYGHQEQRNSNEDSTSNVALARATLNLSKKSAADSIDEVKLNDDKGGEGSKGGGKVGEMVKKIPVDGAIGGELSTSATWSESENSSLGTDVNQVKVSQLLESYRQSEDKYEALESLRERMTELVEDDRRVAVEAKNEHQVDFIQEATDERHLGEKAMDFGRESFENAYEFVTGKDIER